MNELLDDAPSPPRDLTGIGEVRALLAEGTYFEGKLTFTGRARVDGHLTGEVFSDGVLVLGASAKVEGEVEVGTLIVRSGEVRGTVRARQLVELHAAGRIYGDVHAPQLYVEKGSVFEGRVTMEDAKVAPL